MVVYHLAGLLARSLTLLSYYLPSKGLWLAPLIYLWQEQRLAVAVQDDGTTYRTGLGRARTDSKFSYAAAKWTSSAYARMFHLLYQAPTVVLTPS